jgi:hypothetical protein
MKTHTYPPSDSQMICWLENDSNNVMSGKSYVFLMSTISSRNSGFYLAKNVFRVSMAVYVTRRLFTKHSWDIHDDVYLTPIEENTK